MTTNDSRYYLSYLNKFVDQYSIGKKNYINVDQPALTEKIESNAKAPKV